MYTSVYNKKRRVKRENLFTYRSNALCTICSIGRAFNHNGRWTGQSVMADQINLFDTGEDLPLFTGTPQRAKDVNWQEYDAQRQTCMFACSVCMDTGKIKIGIGAAAYKRCICAAAQPTKKGE